MKRADFEKEQTIEPLTEEEKREILYEGWIIDEVRRIVREEMAQTWEQMSELLVD